MAGWRHIILALITILEVSSRVSSLDLGGIKLAHNLMTLSDVGLGRSKIQNFFEDNAVFNSRLPRGERGHEIVKTLAESVGTRFNVYYDVIKELHQAIEKYHHATNTTVILECCKTRDLDIIAACFERSESTAKGQIVFQVDILEKMESLYTYYPHVKWLYFGKENGEFFLYPADPGPNDDCYDYDPRLRPWYAEACAPTPKDIVIAMDTSQKNSSLIKEAVEILLETTNPNDRITVIKFGKGMPRKYLGSSEHSTCFSQELALATPQNREAFRRFIHDTDRSYQGEANFKLTIIPTITEAFKYFHRAADNTNRSKLLVFFAGSDPRDVQSEADIKEIVIEENNRLDKKVVIQTYAVGQGISKNTETILKAMAESTSFNTSDNTNIGTFTRIYDGSRLRYQLHSYYDIFSDSSSVIDPITTVPYFDFSTNGNLVVSICLPVHSNGKLGGVTCVDAELEDIFFNVTYYHQGIDAYAFIIDHRGRTILHPLLHKPTHPLDEPVFIDISTLESDHEVSDIIKSMKSGGSGDKTFYKRLNLFGHNSEQVQNAHVSHYFWSKVPGTDYSLCMVFSDRDGEVSIGRKPDIPDVNYIHPFVLNKEGTKLCQLEHTPAIKDGSVVKFTGSAYRWLSGYVNSNDETQYLRYDNFLTTDTADDQAPELKKTTHWWVELTGQADEIWRKPEGSAMYDSIITWRHLVTLSGVIRVYPGSNFTQYDPNLLSWYKLAILNKDLVQVHAVEKQSSFNLIISQAISVGSPVAFPVAVVGGEVKHTTLYAILENLYSVCKDASCFVMDATGAVLSHKDYTGREKRPSHIITMEYLIANYLQDKGFLVKVRCLDFEKYRTVDSWKLALDGWFISSEWPRFELHGVPGTNMFVGISWDESRSTPCNCETLTHCSDTRCQCPCFENMKFNFCNNTLPERNRNAIPVCSVLKAEFDIIQRPHPDTVTNTLPWCMTTTCEEISLRKDCPEHGGCSWCYADGAEMPGCHHQEMCDPSTSPSTSTTQNNINVVAAAVVSIIVIIALLALLLCLLRHSPAFRERCTGLIWPKTSALDKRAAPVEDISVETVEVFRLPATPPPSDTPEYDTAYSHRLPQTQANGSLSNSFSRTMDMPALGYETEPEIPQGPTHLPSLPSSFSPMAQSSGFSVTMPTDTDENIDMVTYSTVQVPNSNPELVKHSTVVENPSSTVTLTSDTPHENDASREFQGRENPPILTNQHNEILSDGTFTSDWHFDRCNEPQDLSLKHKTSTSNPNRSRQARQSVYSNDEADQKFPDYKSLKLSLNLDENHNSQVKEDNSIEAHTGVFYVAGQPPFGCVDNIDASSNCKSSDSGMESERASSQRASSQTEPKRLV